MSFRYWGCRDTPLTMVYPLIEVVNDDEADAVVFGFCWVTVRLARMKYP
jgi:hypothetical protein